MLHELNSVRKGGCGEFARAIVRGAFLPLICFGYAPRPLNMKSFVFDRDKKQMVFAGIFCFALLAMILFGRAVRFTIDLFLALKNGRNAQHHGPRS
jgi:hypothetical protein